MMRVLVVGYGSMGKRRALHARELGHEVSVSDIKIANAVMAKADGFALPFAEPDALIVSTPASTHAEKYWTGDPIPTLIEKPLALSVQDFWKDASDAAQVLGCDRVGYSFRFHPGIRMLKAGIATLGPVEQADIWMLCDSSKWPGHDYADTLLECSHELDMALHLFGPATVKSAEYGPALDAWSITLAHTSGHETGVLLSTRFSAYARGIKIVGLHGTWVYNWKAPTGEAVIRDASRTPIWRGHVMPDDCYRAELHDFLSNGALGATLAGGLSVLTLCDKAREVATPRKSGANFEARNPGVSESSK